MDWRAKVELFEQIRLEYEFGVGTIQGVARKLRVHRRVVREAIQSAIPARRKKTERPLVPSSSGKCASTSAIPAPCGRFYESLRINELGVVWIDT